MSHIMCFRGCTWRDDAYFVQHGRDIESRGLLRDSQEANRCQALCMVGQCEILLPAISRIKS